MDDHLMVEPAERDQIVRICRPSLARRHDMMGFQSVARRAAIDGAAEITMQDVAS